MYLRKRTLTKHGLTFIVSAILYSEWLVYKLQPLFWPKLKCQDASCTKILFIADPQIQGLLAAPFLLNHIFIIDSDRYLDATLAPVMAWFQPDVLVYLGDLMDEGSISTNEEFEKYVKRLKNIFNMDNNKILNVWIPGDNDIGGEGEPVMKEKVEKFQEEFNQPSVVTYRNISFYKVNGITNTVPKLLTDREDDYKIVVSHYPVTMKYNLKDKGPDGGGLVRAPAYTVARYSSRQKGVACLSVGGQDPLWVIASFYLVSLVHNKIRPNIYFCAHTHSSKYAMLSKDLSNRKMYQFENNKILEVHLNDSALYEVYVPTCSYRMGTSKIGYGVAVLDSDQTLSYAVLWSPQRFPYLFLYLVIGIVVTLYLFYSLILRLCCNSRSNKSYTKLLL